MAGKRAAIGVGGLRDSETTFAARYKKRLVNKKSMRSTEPSHPLPDDSTTSARSSLTALFEWEAVTLDDMAAHAVVVKFVMKKLLCAVVKL